MYLIRLLETPDRDHFGTQAVHRQLMRRCGILYENCRWHHSQTPHHYWQIECDIETLSLLILSGGEIVKI